MKSVHLVLPLVLVLPLLIAETVFAQSAEDRFEVSVLMLGGSAQRDNKQPGRPVVSVRIGDGFPDDLLAFLRSGKHVSNISIQSRYFNDRSAKSLPSLTQIEELSLSGPKITGETLKCVGQM